MTNGTRRRWGVSVTPLYPWKYPGTHCTGGWVDPRAGLDRFRKSRLHRDSIPGPSSPYRVAIPTELPGPLFSSAMREISRFLVPTILSVMSFISNLLSCLCEYLNSFVSNIWSRHWKLSAEFNCGSYRHNVIPSLWNLILFFQVTCRYSASFVKIGPNSGTML